MTIPQNIIINQILCKYNFGNLSNYYKICIVNEYIDIVSFISYNVILINKIEIFLKLYYYNCTY